MRRSAAIGILALAVLVGLSVAGWLVANSVKSPEQAAADAAAPPPSLITAPVEFRVIAETVVTRAEVRPSLTIEVPPPSLDSDTKPVVTRVLVTKGQSVQEGDLLAEIAGRPIIYLEGDFPMFRPLSRGMEGLDVRQMERALSRLGHYSGPEDGVFGPKLERAIHQFYEALGYKPSSSDPGDQPSGDVGNGQPPAGDGGIVVPPGEVFFAQPSLQVERVIATLGSEVGGSSPNSGTSDAVLTLGTAEVIVESMLTVAQKAIVEPGMTAEILSEISGETFEAEVSEVADNPDAGSTTEGYRARIDPDDIVPAELIGQNVRVTIHTASTAAPSLVVPLSAIWSSGDGTAHVTRSAATGMTEEIAVQVGPSVGGFASVEPARGSQLSEGDLVVVGQ